MKGQLHMDDKLATRLLGSPERRIAVHDFEVRAGTGSTYTVRGYASVVEHGYDVYGGAERGGWLETIKRGAFDTTLAAKPDVSFLINHEGTPLARTKSGTLQLRADNTGLQAEAEVDRRDPEGQSLEVKMERGDLDAMSFGFRVTRQSWNEDYTERDITEVNLDNGDVSIVNWPANPATSMSIVSARSAVAVLREMDLAELRGELGNITPAELREAQERLGALVDQIDPRVCPECNQARASIDVHVCTDEDDDYAAGGAAGDGEPSLSDLVTLAVDLLSQAAAGLQQLSATDEGREKADAVVRRFANLLSAAEVKPGPAITANLLTADVVIDGTLRTATAVDGTLLDATGGEHIEIREPAVEEPPADEAPAVVTLSLDEARALESGRLPERPLKLAEARDLLAAS